MAAFYNYFWTQSIQVFPIESVNGISENVSRKYLEFNKMLKETGVELESFVATFDESDFFSIGTNSSLTEKYIDEDPEDIFNIIYVVWEKVAEAILDETGMRVCPFYPDSAIIEADKRKVYLSVENALILNPEIEKKFQEEITLSCLAFGH